MSKHEVVSLIFTICCNFKKETVVSGNYYGYWAVVSDRTTLSLAIVLYQIQRTYNINWMNAAA